MTALQRLTAGAAITAALLTVPMTPAAGGVSVLIGSGGAYAGQHQRSHGYPRAYRKHVDGRGPSHRKHQFESHPRTFQHDRHRGYPRGYGQPRHDGHPRAYRQPPFGSHPRTFQHDRRGAYPRYRFGATPPSHQHRRFPSHPQQRFRSYDRFPYSTGPRRGHRPYGGHRGGFGRH